MKKIMCAALAAVIVIMSAVLCVACDRFTNPGDQLGGGGTGESADAIDVSALVDVQNDVLSACDLSELSANVSQIGAQKVEPTSQTVSVTESGTYLFAGNYGAVTIAAGLDVHFILNNATFTCNDGIAIDGTAKKINFVITLADNSVNKVVNDGDDVNAIHVKGTLSFNGKGSLSVQSASKNCVKCSKLLQITDCALTLDAANHAISALSVAASNCSVTVQSAGKDGLNAECDDETTAFTADEGYVALRNVCYTASVYGDGIQADTAVCIDGGEYNITTTGNFVENTAENRAEYDLTADDFRYIKSGSQYRKVASDYFGRGTMYALSQGCKGIKVGEIEYPVTDGDGEIAVTEGNYLLSIADGTFTLDCTDDALHANSGNIIIGGGNFNITTYDDGITADRLAKITGGNINVLSSYEALEGAFVEIIGGMLSLNSFDDGINAASDVASDKEHIIIGGGNVTVTSDGDGIDSNGSVLIYGGNVVVYGPTSGGDAGLDSDLGVLVDGGTLFVCSSLGMVETPAVNSKQNIVSYAQQTTMTAGTTLSLRDDKNNTFVEVLLTKNCQSVIFSCADLQLGGTYYICADETQLTSFKVSSVITSVGSTGSNFPGGGRPGGPGGGGNPPPRP